MNTVKFTNEHEWLRVDSDGSVSIGITEYAQQQLGDIVYVELPEVGTHLDTVTNLVVIESDRKSTRLNSSHIQKSRMPSSA